MLGIKGIPTVSGDSRRAQPCISNTILALEVSSREESPPVPTTILPRDFLRFFRLMRPTLSLTVSKALEVEKLTAPTKAGPTTTLIVPLEVSRFYGPLWVGARVRLIEALEVSILAGPSRSSTRTLPLEVSALSDPTWPTTVTPPFEVSISAGPR